MEPNIAERKQIYGEGEEEKINLDFFSSKRHISSPDGLTFLSEGITFAIFAQHLFFQGPWEQQVQNPELILQQ